MKTKKLRNNLNNILEIPYQLGILTIKLIKIVQRYLKLVVKRCFHRTKHSKFHILNSKLLIIALAIIVLLGPAVFLLSKKPKTAEAGWWNDRWQYRKPITISSGSSAASDFQVKISDYDTSSDISNGKMQGDCGDIRFTSSDGVSLPYWVVDDTCNTSTTDIWVKVDDIPPTGGTTIYMYYGNSSADNGEDGNQVFEFFDDFEDSSIDTSKWGGDNSDFSENADSLVCTTDNVGMYSKDFEIQEGIVETRVKGTDSSDARASIMARVDVGTGNSDYNDEDGYRFRTRINTNDDLTLAEYNSGSWTANSTSSYTLANDTWYEKKFVFAGTSLTGYINGSSQITDTDSTYQNAGAVGINTHNNAGFAWDWFFVRKYMPTEPSAGSPGTEEKGTGPVAYWSFDEGYGTTVHNQMESNGENGLESWWKFDDASSGTSPAPVDSMRTTAGSWGGNASYTSTAKVGNSADFDGASDYVDTNISKNYPSEGSFTVSTWLKVDSTSQQGRRIVVDDENDSGWSLTLGDASTQDLRFFIRGKDTVSLDTSSNPISSTSEWYHVAAVYNHESSQRFIYVNGKIEAQDLSDTGTPSSDAGDIMIGGRAVSGANCLDGKIDSVKIYNRPLSEGEINAEYQSLHGHMMSMDADQDWVDGARQNPNQKPMGKALDFDGSNDYVSCGANSDLNWGAGDGTVTAWIKTSTDYNSSYGVILIKGAGGVSQKRYVLHIDGDDGSPNNRARFDIDDDGGSLKSVAGSTAINDGKWHHLVGVRDGDNLRLYIDGVEDANSPTDITGYGDIDDTEACTIGANNNSGSQGDNQFFNGQIDEVKVFKYALTADQVKAEYNRGYSQVMGAGEDEGRGDDPVGFWKLDEKTGYLAPDSSGNENHGTLTSMDPETDWVSGKVGGGLDFDGSDDFVEISDDNNLDFNNTDFTLSHWVKLNDISGSGRMVTIMKKEDNGSTSDNDTNYNLYIQGGGSCSDGNMIGFQAGNGSGNTLVCSDGEVSDTQWHYVVIVFDASESEVSFYIDGTLDSTKSFATNPAANAHPLIFGKHASSSSSGDYFFDGVMDHVKVYDYVRSPEEIHYDMATGSPIAHWSMDEGYGTNVYNQKQSNVEDDLISWWKFDDASSGTSPSPVDQKDNYAGTWGGGANYTTTSYVGYAADFDGGNDYVSFGDVSEMDSPSEFTFMAWFQRDSDVGSATNHSVENVIVAQSSSSSNDNFELGSDGSYIDLYLDTTDDDTMQSYDAGISNGTWYHVAVVFDGGNDETKLYLDGELLTTWTNWGGSLDSSDASPFSLGLSRPGDGGSGDWGDLNGQIDQVKLFNRVVDANEVALEYNSLHGHMINMEPDGDWVDGAKSNSNQRPMGKALDFDGSNDFVDTGNNSALNITEELTISLWVKMDDAGSDISPNQYFVNKGTGSYSDATSNSYHFFIANTTTDTITMALSDGSSITNTTSTSELYLSNFNSNNWYHFVGTWDGSTMKIYVDGKHVSGADTAFSGPINSLPSANLLLGKLGDNSRFYDGKMDEVKVYNYALSEDQVKVEYNRGKAMVLGVGQSESEANSDNLIGWWKMDTGRGSLVFDSSQNDNTGTRTNMSGNQDWVQGKFGKALDFDGTNDYVDLGTAILDTSNSSQAHTVSAWVKSTASSALYTHNIISQTSSVVSDRFRLIMNSSGKIVWYKGGVAIATSDSSVNDGQWHHIVGTKNSSGTVTIYIDGVAEDTGTDSEDFENTNTYIGYSTSDTFDGQIDDVKIWDTDLSNAEIAWEYNQGKPIAHWRFDGHDGVIAKNASSKSVSTDGLVAFWTMNDTSGRDYSGGSHTLTNSGATTSTDGVKNNSLDFESSEIDYMYRSDDDSLDYQGNGITVSAWVKLESSPSSNHFSIVDKSFWNSTTDNGGYALTVRSDTGDFRFSVRNSNGSANYKNAESTSNPSTGEWYHVVGTYDNSTVKIYVNGQLNQSDSYSGGVMNITDSFVVGCGPTTTNYFDGKIDHVKVWQRALDNNEINIEYAYDEKYGYLTNMDASSDWVEGRFNNAIDFDGSNDYISTVGDDLDFGTNNFSISLWFKSSSFHSSNNGAFLETADAIGDFWPLISLRGNSSGSLTYYIRDDDSDAISTTTSQTYDDNVWHQAVITRSGTTGSLYVDGKQIHTDTDSGLDDVSTGSDWFIGRTYDSTARYIDSAIDEVKIYNYALTANQVKLDYNNSKAVRLE